MRLIHTILMLTVCLALIAMFAGCSIYGADDGAIRGVVFYNDNQTIVPEPWVAIYQASAPDVIFFLVQGDTDGRYSALVPEGDYIALGSYSKDGPFTGLDTAFHVKATVTTVKSIVTDMDSP